MELINDEQLTLISGGYWNWNDIPGSIGYNIGSAAGWYYENVLIGNPWSNLQIQ